MLLLCKVNISAQCIKIRSKHGNSAQTKDAICPFCAQALRDDPKLGEKSLESIKRGLDNGRNRNRR